MLKQDNLESITRLYPSPLAFHGVWWLPIMYIDVDNSDLWDTLLSYLSYMYFPRQDSYKLIVGIYIWI